MFRYRGYLLAFTSCFIIEGVIYYGLFGLGASERIVLTVEMLWLLATVAITITVGERVERKSGDRGD